MVVSLDEISRSSSTQSLHNILPKWEISFSALEEKESLGKGAIGDFKHCIWKGIDVCVTQFIFLFQSLILLSSLGSTKNTIKPKVGRGRFPYTKS